MNFFTRIYVPLLIFGISILTPGCVTNDTKSAKSVHPTPSQQNNTSAINHITFSLPKGIAWEKNQDVSFEKTGIAEWIMKGYNSKTTPMRVIYQKKLPGVKPERRMQQLLTPLKQCAESKITSFKGQSTFPHQFNVESFCSQMGKGNFGLISYAAVFSNYKESHVLIGEVRTPPTKKAGIFPAKSPEEKKRSTNIKAVGKMMFDMVNSIRVCDENKNCR